VRDDAKAIYPSNRFHHREDRDMGTALDQVMEDRQAQEFWLRRFIAIVIDYLILWIPIMVISSIAWSFGIFGQVPTVLAGVLVWFYAAFFEAELGYTIGKRIMNLQVVSLDGRPYDLQRGIVRNLSKIHWILLLIDLLGGILAENRTNMRYLDIVTNCEVVDNEVAEWRRSQGLTPPVGAQAPAEPGVVVEPGDQPPEPAMPPEAEDEPEALEDEDALEVVPEAPEEPLMPPKAPEEKPAYQMDAPTPEEEGEPEETPSEDTDEEKGE
jgi:hypothetical protein